MRTGTAASVIGVVLSVLGPGAGCGGGPATATERLWVSNVPTKAKEPITAFVTTRSTEERFLGAFFQGSMLRGSHDVFSWEDTGPDRARIEFLQDGRTHALQLETCKPSRGFDLCLKVYGDPTGTIKYQSRKRWVVRRPGRKRDATGGLVLQAMHELAEDDGELAAALDAAAPEGWPR